MFPGFELAPGNSVTVWKVDGDVIRVYGTKRVGRHRTIPLLWMPVKPTVTREVFKAALRKLDLGVTPKHGRNAYAQWMEEAGVLKSRRDVYLGHSVVIWCA